MYGLAVSFYNVFADSKAKATAGCIQASAGISAIESFKDAG